MAYDDQEWRQSIVNKLRERNRRDVEPFKEIIQQSEYFVVSFLIKTIVVVVIVIDSNSWHQMSKMLKIITVNELFISITKI